MSYAGECTLGRQVLTDSPIPRMLTMNARLIFSLFCLAIAAPARADGPADNVSENVRPIPPAGVAVPEPDRARLKAGLEILHREISDLPSQVNFKPALLDLLPDVQIY